VGRGEFVHRAARADADSTFEYFADSRAHACAGRAHLDRASTIEHRNADPVAHARADALKNKKPGEKIFSPGFFVELFLQDHITTKEHKEHKRNK
jgi:hypothetical protein